MPAILPGSSLGQETAQRPDIVLHGFGNPRERPLTTVLNSRDRASEPTYAMNYLARCFTTTALRKRTLMAYSLHIERAGDDPDSKPRPIPLMEWRAAGASHQRCAFGLLPKLTPPPTHKRERLSVSGPT